MNPRRNSQLLKSLKTLSPKEEKHNFKFNRNKKYNYKGKETNLIKLGEQKALYLLYLDKIKEINFKHGMSVIELDKLLKELKMEPKEKTKIRDHNEIIRKDMVTNKAKLAELETIEEEIKVMQIILERTADQKLIDQYFNIIDVLNNKSKAYVNAKGNTVDPRAPIFARNAMIEITKIIKSTPPKDIPQALRVITSIIVNW